MVGDEFELGAGVLGDESKAGVAEEYRMCIGDEGRGHHEYMSNESEEPLWSSCRCNIEGRSPGHQL